MTTTRFSCLLFWLACCFIHRGRCQTYIVMLKSGSLMSESEKDPTLKNAENAMVYKQQLSREHDGILSSLSGREARKIHDYSNVINGFSAALSADQVKELGARPDVGFVLENRLLRNLAADSPAFKYMGLQGVPSAAWSKTTGEDVVIGVIDSGIFPESPSFNDSGLKPMPTKAICQQPLDSGPPFRCNNKIIGARYFYKGYEAYTNKSVKSSGDYLSARDTDGHGTHVASIAAGSIVRNVANVTTLRGVAYNARLMVYKVGWGLGADSYIITDDMIAALDAGVGDGVDVFSISLVYDVAPPFYLDPWGLVMLEITAKGIPLVLAGGNSGGVGTVVNPVPWVLTVAASGYPSQGKSAYGLVKLINRKKFKGAPSPAWGTLSKDYYSLVDSRSIGISKNSSEIKFSELCYPGSLDPEKARGKIVVCLRGEIARVNKSLAVFQAGGIGMIMYNQEGEESLLSDPHSVPSLHVYRESGLSIIEYINSTGNPKATPLVESLSNPYITDFSSTGPNSASQFILKPDIAAPGENILAAFTNFSSSRFEPTGSYVRFSGTSMSTPHVAAAVALIKSLNMTWKPSWLYSAIITSASLRSVQHGCIEDFVGDCANPFQMGGGHLDVRRAIRPGLVYDMSGEDYINILCTESGGYYVFVRNCPYLFREVDFNLPYLSIPNFSRRLVTRRTLTLVGPPSQYRVSILQPVGANVTVTPSTLNFTTKYQTLSYVITVQALPPNTSTMGASYSRWGYTFGRITWLDRTHTVNFNVALNFAS